MIGRVIEEEGQKIVQTLAGATAGTVCKVNYGIDCNYAIPITHNELGEGYVGLSCVCPGPYYNPVTGTLSVCNVLAKSSDAEKSDKVMSNSLTGDAVYNLAIWCATSDGCYNSVGFSGGRSITYNPYSATLNTCCATINDLLTATCVCITCNLTAECGNFSSLTVTNKIDGSICKADGINCYDQYCLDYFAGSADRPLLMTNATDAECVSAAASIGRSTNCSLTYNPSTGVLKRCGAEMAGYTLTLDSAQGGTRYALIDVGSCNGNVIEGKIYSNTFSLVKFCAADAIYRHSDDYYGDIAVGHINNTTTCVWIRYGGWINPELFGQKPIKLVCSTTTAPSDITFVNSKSKVCEAVCSYYTDSAVCAQYHCRCSSDSAADFDISLENGYSNASNAVTYVSSSCRLRYCNTTGYLRITNASGCLAGTISANQLCVGTGGIETHYNVNGYCDNSSSTRTWQIHCDGSACFNSGVMVCGYLRQGGSDVVTEQRLAPLGVCKFSISGNTLIISAR